MNLSQLRKTFQTHALDLLLTISFFVFYFPFHGFGVQWPGTEATVTGLLYWHDCPLLHKENIQ